MPTAPLFNLNAPPRTGQGPFGLVPGAIGLPPIYNDVAGVFPGLSGNLGALSANISSDLAGELDPQTIEMLQNTAAQFGIGQGTPLSPFSGARGLRQLGLTAEAQRRQGASNLLSALPTVANTLTVRPETQLEVADRNATLNAAPDPAQAAREAQRLFDLYMARLSGRIGGGMSFGGGGGAPRNTNASSAGVFDSPWAPFQPQSERGTRASEPFFSGTGINWGKQGAAPIDLWNGQGPPQSQTGYWDEWFDWNPGAGSVSGVGAGAQNDMDYWNDWFGFEDNQTPDFSYLEEWGSGG